MRFLTILLCFFVTSAFSQYPSNTYTFNFETNPIGSYKFVFDSASNHINCWHVGRPQKTVLSSAHTSFNVIITDTLNPYPPSDTSSFTIRHVSGCTYCPIHWRTLSGYYFVDSDTLTDYGKIEFSSDSGLSWTDLLTDNNCTWFTLKPVLSGRSSGWHYFEVRTQDLWISQGIQAFDSVYFRFTFISDANHSGKGGLMFDDITIHDDLACLSLPLHSKTVKAKCYPNPSKENITIEFRNPDQDSFVLVITNEIGKQILTKSEIKEKKISVNTSSFPNGIYFYKLSCKEKNKEAQGKFLISR
ncbi:MAG: T9SS type A sorting domain-containing protein [Bacteroidota bacterium]